MNDIFFLCLVVIPAAGTIAGWAFHSIEFGLGFTIGAEFFLGICLIFSDWAIEEIRRGDLDL